MKLDLVKLPAPRLASEPAARPAPAGSAAADTTPPAPAPATNAQQARAAAQEASRRLAEKASELTIEFDDDLRRMVFRLVDTRTREVVRQIPSEEVLAIARALEANLSSGVMLRTDA